MAEELIRKTNLLGNNKVIVGNGQTDVVLDTLGKVYIKTGNNLKVLTDIISQISKLSKNKSDLELLNKVLIVNNIEKIDYPGDGILIFDLSLNSLYISYDERYILIINLVDKLQNLNNPEKPQISSEYVKKSGDIMTGALSITTTTAPLIIASKQLIYNLNAQFLNGHTSYEFAQKAIDEYITGHWTFEDVDISDTLKVKDRAVISNIIGTEQFSGGYLGTGWRIDSNTNTMTVDHLIVRKTMRVFELIVNQIRATNGSVWITDTCKIKNVFDIQLLNLDDDTSEIRDNIWYIPYSRTKNFNYSLKIIEGSHLANYQGYGITTNYHTFGFIVKCSNNFFNFQTLKEFLLNLTLDYDKNNIDIVCFFDEHKGNFYLPNNISGNSIINTSETPRFYSTKDKKLIPKNEILEIYTYYKYFGTKELSTKYIKVVEADHEKYPTLREGDIIRCLKFKDNNIKYYDALVASSFNSYFYIIIVAPSVFDKYKDDTVNIDYYSLSNLTNIKGATLIESKTEILAHPEIILDNILAKDEVVRIGSISDPNRQGSVYLSSSEEDSPMIRVLNGVNKPDFNVAYRYPLFLTKLPEEGGPQKYYKVVGNSYIYYDIPNIDCAMAVDPSTRYIKSIYNNHIKTLLGNLKSIENDVFEKDQPEGYGLYGENVYLTGKFILASTGVSVENSINESSLNIKELLDKDIANINKQLDGKIITWYSLGDPNDENFDPRNQVYADGTPKWEGPDEEHYGDVCYDEVNSKVYKFLKNKEIFVWLEFKDPSLKIALELSSKALTAVNGKCQVFLKTPEDAKDQPKYYLGDLWIDATYSPKFNKDLAVCTISNVSDTGEVGKFDLTHWKLAGNYLDSDIIINMADNSIITPFEKPTFKLYQDNLKQTYDQIKTSWDNKPKNIKSNPLDSEDLLPPPDNQIWENYNTAYLNLNTILDDILKQETFQQNYTINYQAFSALIKTYNSAESEIQSQLNIYNTDIITVYDSAFRSTKGKFISLLEAINDNHTYISKIEQTAKQISLTVQDTYKFEEIGNAYGTACDVFFVIDGQRVYDDIVKDSNKISCIIPNNFNSSTSNNLNVNLPYEKLSDWFSDFYTIAFNFSSTDVPKKDFYILMGTFVSADGNASNFGGGFYHNVLNERIQIQIQKPKSLGKALLLNFWFHNLKPSSLYTISNLVLEKGKIDHPLIWRPSLYDLKINKSLLATGIDILNKTITVTADNFLIQDNNENSSTLINGGKIRSDFIDVLALTCINKNSVKTRTINILNEGEDIFYWPDGSIMNCKIFLKTDNIVSGCIEYFFEKGKISLDDVKLGYLHLDSKGFLKRINYFAPKSFISLLGTTKMKYYDNTDMLNAVSQPRLDTTFQSILWIRLKLIREDIFSGNPGKKSQALKDLRDILDTCTKPVSPLYEVGTSENPIVYYGNNNNIDISDYIFETDYTLELNDLIGQDNYRYTNNLILEKYCPKYRVYTLGGYHIINYNLLSVDVVFYYSDKGKVDFGLPGSSPSEVLPIIIKYNGSILGN